MNKIIGSKEALDNFQFVTINGKVVFHDKERVLRIARAYSQVVKSAINPLLEGRNIEELTKGLYSILPNYIYKKMGVKGAESLASLRRGWIAPL